MTSSNTKELKILIWEKRDINELLALLDKMPIGYKKEGKYDVLFFNKSEN